MTWFRFQLDANVKIGSQMEMWNSMRHACFIDITYPSNLSDLDNQSRIKLWQYAVLYGSKILLYVVKMELLPESV